MTIQHYAQVDYGMLIPEKTDTFNTICKKLRELHPELKEYEDDLVLLNIVESDYIDYNVEVIYTVGSDTDIYTLSNEYETYNDNNYVVLKGIHGEPSLTSSPFESKEDCIEHYKEIYGKILPENFNYEENIAKITFSLYG